MFRWLPSGWWQLAIGAALLAGAVQACSLAAVEQASSVATRITPVLPLGVAKTGAIELLTYNVAGLPEIVSPSRPTRNLPLVSPLLNAYDLVVAQEDFAYHDKLVSQVVHPYQFEPKPARDAFVGNGLTTLSNFPLEGVEHVVWESCNGYLTALSDCLSEKGFSVGRVHLSRDVSVDIYNIHADAGADADDVTARVREYQQLANHVQTHSRGRAVVLAGDTNLDVAVAADRAILDRFLSETGLADSCRQVTCAREGIDRVFVRSSGRVELRAVYWAEDPRFVDAQGEQLSDHPAVAVRIAWAAR